MRQTARLYALTHEGKFVDPDDPFTTFTLRQALLEGGLFRERYSDVVKDANRFFREHGHKPLIRKVFIQAVTVKV